MTCQLNLCASDAATTEPGSGRTSRTLLATMAKRARVQTTRSKPNLSVRIPPPLIIPCHTLSSTVHTPTSPSLSSTHPNPKLPGNTSSRPNGQQPHSPHTPATPSDQIVVLHPTNPPAIKPRYSRGNDKDGDEAYNRRVERLFAPTPTEWSFSSTLNRIPTPPSDYFDRIVFPGSEQDSSHADECCMLIDDDIARVSSEGEVEHKLSNFPAVQHPQPPPLGCLPAATLNIALQPLASPYATRFPSPATSIISLAPASGASTPRSISPVASFSSSRSRKNSINIGVTSNSRENEYSYIPNGVGTISLPFPSSFSSATTPPGPGSGGIPSLCRPSVVQRRSSLGPNRFSMESSVSTGNGGLRQPRRSMTMGVTGYFDCHPDAPLSTDVQADANSAPADVNVEVELNDCPTTTPNTPTLDV